MKVAISFFGTGNYLNFLPNWYESIKDNLFPEVEKKFIVFTDGEGDFPEDVVKVETEHFGWPDVFYKTFETILRAKNIIEECDWFISIDADMLVNQYVSVKEFLDSSKDYIGVHHPCHYLQLPPHNKFPGSFDTNPLSNAYISEDMDTSVYYQGCLWGGKVPAIIEMMKLLDKWTKEDIKNNSVPVWYEESYFNKFFITNKNKVNTLSPSFAYPEDYKQYCDFEEKITHISKNNQQLHKQ
jgi:hypothetical protein